VFDQPLTTERLMLREFTAEDHDGVHAYAADPEVCRFSEWGPNTPEETTVFLNAAAHFRRRTPRDQFSLAVVQRSDLVLVGAVDLHVTSILHARGEMGYVFRRSHWGRGYATEAAAAILRFGLTVAGLHKISATCDPDNVASARVLEKIGMTREGYLRQHTLQRGAWRDRLLYATTGG
jgi:ribosomal-protein-alanine N-acetyltransferase